MRSTKGLSFVKGHGTQNDFVVLPDLAEADLTPALVRAICDRRTGLGADGVLRVAGDAATGFFMDYRNADGSVAETCGNGIRVFARYLVEETLVNAGEFVVHTRRGPCRVQVPAAGADITVDMGTPQRLPDGKVSIGDASWPAQGVSMGNPHLVVLDAPGVDSLDLSRPPEFSPAESYPDGANIEFCETGGDHHLTMRVHERGVGETRSCGSGACAAAVAAMEIAGERAAYRIDVPGGRLRVEWHPDGTVSLAGPAVLVARGEYSVV